jgi:hypothetical protein
VLAVFLFLSSQLKSYNSENILYKIIITYLLVVFPLILLSQETEKLIKGSVEQPVPEINYDIISADSLQVDSIVVDSVQKSIIEAPIIYNALDSIIISFDGQKVFLYNQAKVTYQNIELSAYFIELDLETKQIYAEGILDSSEVLVQKPIFKQGSEEYESETMRYNFETEKAFITNVVSQQGEGRILSDRTKKIGKKVFITEKAKYSTCDADHPHFYLHLSKAKVIANEKIITGPAYLVLEDFPIYFPFIPFGYFPNSPTYSSGILVPTYGEEQNRGFFLRDGGYYWAASEYFDVAVRGDIYSKGSWGAKLHTNYKVRYKFSGGFDFKYAMNIYGESGLDTYSRSPQFQVAWSHSQDAKSNPSRTFSASVNFSTSGYDKQNSLSAQNYLRTQKSSSISYTRKFENTPFNMSMNVRHSQNSTDTTLSLSLPEMTFSMAKVYPFRKKKRTGSLKFYEKFGISYTGNIKNTITAKEYEILDKAFPQDWKNGIKHNIPISFPSFNLAKFINVSPSIGYNEKWYFNKKFYSYHEDETYPDPFGQESHVKIDTITGINRIYDYSYSLSTSTNIYGMYLPLNPDSKIKGIRHKFTPSASFSYRPDFGAPKYGYWQPVQIDSMGTIRYFDTNAGGVYGGSPGRGASGAISLSLNNNVEMKVLDTKDTTKTDADQVFKKVKIIDNLSFATSYNLIADSLNLAPISMRARTTIAGVSINMGGILDPYEVNADYRKINQFVWNTRKGIQRLGRLTRANLSFGMSFKSKKGEKEAEINKELVDDADLFQGGYDDYIDFNIPWDFGFDYSVNYSGASNSYPNGKVTQTLGFRGNVNLTEKWRVSMNSNFDIMAGEFSFTTFSVNRDLHCWAMSFNFVPFGERKSYSFTINAKSSMLKDLKLQKKQSHYDNF